MVAAVHQESAPAAVELRAFVDEAPTAIAMFDDEMRYLACSERWRSDYGLPGPVLGRCHYDFFPEMPERWRGVHRRCLAGATEREDEDLFIRADGSRQWVRWEGRPWRTVDGNIGGITIFAEDITARVEAHRQRAESEARLQLALDASNAGLWTIDAATNRIEWDRRSWEMFGFGSGAAGVADGDLTHVHPQDLERLLRRWNDMRHGLTDDRWDEEFRIVLPDGSCTWIHGRGRAERDASSRVVRLSGINLDITERMRALEALRRGQERLGLALDAATAGSWTLDPIADTLTGDARYASRFGRAANQPMPRQHVMRSIHHDDRARVQAVMDDVCLPGRPDGWEMEYRVPQPDQSVLWMLSIGRVTRDESGRALRIDGITLDITARKLAEAEIERSHEALRQHAAELERTTTQLRRLAADLTLVEQRTREQLARTLHDDIQQLLFSALLQLERVARSSADSAALDRARMELEAATEAARSLSVELCPPALRLGGFPGALEWLAEWFRQKFSLTVKTDLDATADPADEVVRVLLFESVRELLFNAVKHARVETVSLSSSRDGQGQLYITVSDDGTGFTPSTAIRSDAIVGGLGLFGIRERLVLLGGRMEIESAPGRGARFALVVPGEAGRERSVAQPADDVSGVRTGDEPAAGDA